MANPTTDDALAMYYLTDVLGRFRRLKAMGDHAVSQVDDEAFYTRIDAQSNSIALIVKHIAGNMRSRWRDFLTTDGEKPDRHRDKEFERLQGDTRQALLARWEEGWQHLFDALEPLAASDLTRTVCIREQPHSVMQAINRQLAHYAYHVGQVVFLAKHLRTGNWQWMSIPPGQSAQYNEAMRRAAEQRGGPDMAQ